MLHFSLVAFGNEGTWTRARSAGRHIASVRPWMPPEIAPFFAEACCARARVNFYQRVSLDFLALVQVVSKMRFSAAKRNLFLWFAQVINLQVGAERERLKTERRTHTVREREIVLLTTWSDFCFLSWRDADYTPIVLWFSWSERNGDRPTVSIWPQGHGGRIKWTRKTLIVLRVGEEGKSSLFFASSSSFLCLKAHEKEPLF